MEDFLWLKRKLFDPNVRRDRREDIADIDSLEKGMLFQMFVVKFLPGTRSESLLRIFHQKSFNQVNGLRANNIVLNKDVNYFRELQLDSFDFLEDSVFSRVLERGLEVIKLVEDTSKGPQVGRWLADVLFEKLRGDVAG